MLSVTKISICSRRGANNRPGSGYVTFSDGRDYYWSAGKQAGDDNFYLMTERFGHWGHNTHYCFRVKGQRDAALRAALNR
jgi:hypothetical protein